MKIIKKKIKGNYELRLRVNGAHTTKPIKIFFSANDNLSKRSYINILANEFKLCRELDGKIDMWKRGGGVGSFPWDIRVLKKGNYYRFWLNGITESIRGPMGEWEGIGEPWTSHVGLETDTSVVIDQFTLTTLPWLSEHHKPVIPVGPKGSFYEQQAIPNGIIEFRGKYYLYFMAGMKGDEEGASRRTVGMASSDDLLNWEVHPDPIIRNEDINFASDNVYPNAAVVTPERKIALMYSAQRFPEWQGFGLATADQPLGPFKQHPRNPVFKHFTHAHEFDMIRVDHPDYRYVLFYAGYTPEPKRGLPGDRGWLLMSNDLVNWRHHPQNPVFEPETLENWDAIHIRPRSLNKIDDTWYLWYEGCNRWDPPGQKHHGWWDSVGLARSKNLVDWEYYPRNPALPGLGTPGQFDNGWIGWPRMYVKNDTGYIFYTGAGAMLPSVGLRRIPLSELTNWDSEGGEVIDLLENNS